MPVLRQTTTGRIFPYIKLMAERDDMEVVDDVQESKKQRAPKQPKAETAPVSTAAPVVTPAAEGIAAVQFEE